MLHRAHYRATHHATLCLNCAGNDLSRSFGWGAAYKSQWFDGHKHTFASLMRVRAGGLGGGGGGPMRAGMGREGEGSSVRCAAQGAT